MKCKQCANQIPKDHKLFCSYACFTKYSFKTRRVQIECKNCKKDFSVKKTEYEKGRTFCSIKCRSEFGRTEIVCALCNKRVSVFKSRLGGKNRKVTNNYCSKKCFYEHKETLSLGELNPNYRNGSRALSRVIRGLSKYLKWKKAVVERDKYVCQFCNKVFPFSGLEAHHKVRLWKLIEDYPRQPVDVRDEYFYDINNGMTLCEHCHDTTYGKDEDIIE